MPNTGKSLQVHPFVERDSAIFKRNLAALSAAQPTVATAVAAASLPPVEPAKGRDGTPTLKLRDGAGRGRWFGGSSMPSVSAAEMFRSVDGEAGNFSLPGILTGIEPLTILDTLPAYRALFVIEDDPANLKLAMHLYDYAEVVSRGRLVFVLGDDVAGGLREYFQARPGCEMPTRMFTVPHRGASATAELQRRLELTGEAVVGIQSRVMEALTQSIRSIRRKGLLDAPRTAVVTVDPSAWTADDVQRTGQALERLGWKCAVVAPDRPDRCHLVARLQSIERLAADWVIVVNGFPGPLRAVLPFELPIVSWFSPIGLVPRSLGAGVSPLDLFFATSRVQLEALRAAGVPETAMRLSGGAVDETRPIDVNAERRFDVAIVTDLPDARAQACGINLPSHVLLWGKLQEIVCRLADEDVGVSADQLLEEAERQSAMRLEEPVVREQFVELLRGRMAPAALGGSIFAALRQGGVRVGVWGSGWGALPGGGVSSRGPIPTGRSLRDILASTHRLVLFSLSGVGVHIALDALAAGTAVLVRGEREAFESDYPALSAVARFFTFWRNRAELAHWVSTPRPEPSAASRGLTEHTMQRRLLEMRDEVRSRQVAKLAVESEVRGS